MSRISFRARPVDPDRAMPVMHQPETYFSQSDSGISRSVVEVDVGLEDESLAQKEMLEARQRVPSSPPKTEKTGYRKRHGAVNAAAVDQTMQMADINNMGRIVIPVPIIRYVDDGSSLRTGYNKPNAYTKFCEKNADAEYDHVDYDLDSEDERFVSEHNQQCSEPSERLPDVILEKLIDRFEKETGASPELVSEPIAWRSVSGTCSQQQFRVAYAYWAKRRRSRFFNKRDRANFPGSGRPLLTGFVLPPDFNDPDPHVAFRPREPETRRKTRRMQNDADVYTKMIMMKGQMKAALEITDKLCRRERLKYNHLLVKIAEFNADISSLHCKYAGPLVDRLRRETGENEEADSKEAEAEVRRLIEEDYKRELKREREWGRSSTPLWSSSLRRFPAVRSNIFYDTVRHSNFPYNRFETRVLSNNQRPHARGAKVKPGMAAAIAAKPDSDPESTDDEQPSACSGYLADINDEGEYSDEELNEYAPLPRVEDAVEEPVVGPSTNERNRQYRKAPRSAGGAAASLYGKMDDLPTVHGALATAKSVAVTAAIRKEGGGMNTVTGDVYGLSKPHHAVFAHMSFYRPPLATDQRARAGEPGSKRRRSAAVWASLLGTRGGFGRIGRGGRVHIDRLVQRGG